MTTSFTSRQLATNYEILVARTEFLVALATRKAQFRTLAWTPKIKKTPWAFISPKVIYGIHYFYFSSKSFISWGHKQDDS